MNLGTWLSIGFLFALGFVGNASNTPHLLFRTKLTNLIVVTILWPFFLGAHCQIKWDWEL